MPIPDNLIDLLLEGCSIPEDTLGESGECKFPLMKEATILLTPFFDYPPQIRKVIYTTNAIESLNTSLRKLTKTRRSFPTDESVLKVLYQIGKKWTMPIRGRKQAMSQFMILFG